ncbi:MAG: hypothetical protein IPP31_01140 [Chitinophagaceae bacterium]|nr:hypothetical protein [Chitinophagaceae bacterium]
MNETVSQALKNWIPYRLNEQSDPLSCRWLYLDNEPITEPFFDETISKCMKQAENSHWLKAVSSLDILPEWSQQIETVKPSAIIFHISRCGSTLVSQLLSQQSSNIVLSEVPFFDALLRWGKKNDKEEEASELLRASIQLYGARRNENKIIYSSKRIAGISIFIRSSVHCIPIFLSSSSTAGRMK